MGWVEKVAKDLHENAFWVEVFSVTVDRTHEQKNGITDSQPCQKTVEYVFEPVAEEKKMYF